MASQMSGQPHRQYVMLVHYQTYCLNLFRENPGHILLRHSFIHPLDAHMYYVRAGIMSWQP